MTAIFSDNNLKLSTTLAARMKCKNVDLKMDLAEFGGSSDPLATGVIYYACGRSTCLACLRVAGIGQLGESQRTAVGRLKKVFLFKSTLKENRRQKLN